MKPRPNTLEVRTAPKASLRALKGTFQINGIAAAYNTRSSNLGGFREVIAPGAFTNSLRNNADVKCLFNHDPNTILGRTKSGTLTLADSPEGLRFTCQLDPTNSEHKNIYASISRGDVDSCSFAFVVPEGGDDWQDNACTDDNGRAIPLRTLRNVDLRDCSAVVHPAYPQGTSVDARGKNAWTPDEKLKDELRRQQAKVIGQLVAEDRAALAAEEVSSIREKLAAHLASKGTGWRLIHSDEKHCYALPNSAFDDDPDMSDVAAMAKCARYNWEIDPNGQVILTSFSTRWANEVDPTTGQLLNTNSRPVLDELREASKLARHMRESAGIFTR